MATPRRTAVLNAVITELKRINGGVDSRAGLPRTPYTYKSTIYNNVFRGFKYLDRINDFPTICVFGADESRVHIGSGIKYGTFELRIRGYVWSDDKSMALAEDLADDIDFIIESLHRINTYCGLEIVDARVLSLSTDDGLLAPWGLCDLIAEVAYQIDETIS